MHIIKHMHCCNNNLLDGSGSLWHIIVSGVLLIIVLFIFASFAQAFLTSSLVSEEDSSDLCVKWLHKIGNIAPLWYVDNTCTIADNAFEAIIFQLVQVLFGVISLFQVEYLMWFICIFASFLQVFLTSLISRMWETPAQNR